MEKLDLSALSEDVPCLLVSLWIYAYRQSVGSAREISRLSGYHPAYRWLTGAEEISGHTLSDFRVKHQTALEKLFVEVVGVLSAGGSKPNSGRTSAEYRTNGRIFVQGDPANAIF